MHKIVHKLPNALQMWPCWYSGLLMFTWLLLLSQSAAPPHFPALLSRWWKTSQQTRAKWQMWTWKIQISVYKYKYVALLALMAGGAGLCDHTAHSPLAQKLFWANLNPIRKPGRHLPDIISYHPNEDWWLAKGTNWCCPWEKGLNGSPGLLLATNSLSDRADAISCPPQSWHTGHGDALNGEKLV